MWAKFKWVLFIVLFVVALALFLKSCEENKIKVFASDWLKLENLILKQIQDESKFVYVWPSLLRNPSAARKTSFANVSYAELKEGVYPEAEKIWVVLPNERSKMLKDMEEWGFTLIERYNLVPLYVFEYKVPARKGFYSFTQNLQETEAYIAYEESSPEIAVWANGAWAFPKSSENWNRIMKTKVFLGNQKRECVWFHPLSDAKKIIKFKGFPLGERIVIFGGIADNARKTPPGSPVYLTVQVGESYRKTIKYEDNQISLLTTLGIAEFARTEQDVLFEVSTENQFKRHFCFTAHSA